MKRLRNKSHGSKSVKELPVVLHKSSFGTYVVTTGQSLEVNRFVGINWAKQVNNRTSSRSRSRSPSPNKTEKSTASHKCPPLMKHSHSCSAFTMEKKN